MSTATAELLIAVPLPEAEAAWYETSRWAEWVDGLAEIESVSGDWPRSEACVIWRSGPAGRGRVREQVLRHELHGGQTVAVQDDTIRGEQAVAFVTEARGVVVTLALRYELVDRNPLAALVDLLFVRRAMAASLRRTLERFALSVEADQ